MPVAFNADAVAAVTERRLVKNCSAGVERVQRGAADWSVRWQPAAGMVSRPSRHTSALRGGPSYHVSRRLGASNFEWEWRDDALEWVGSEHTIVISAMSSVR